jgi:cell division topological specificity factor MinE
VGIWSKLIGQLQSSPSIQCTEVSASAAKERLKLALTYDRNGLEQGTIESLRRELVRLMAEHLDVQTADVEVNIDESTGPNRLVASIALRPSRRSRPTATAATEAN